MDNYRIVTAGEFLLRVQKRESSTREHWGRCPRIDDVSLDTIPPFIPHMFFSTSCVPGTVMAGRSTEESELLGFDLVGSE